MMKHVPLGCSGLAVSALGLGCMGMSEFYGPTDEASSLATLERALELGVGLLDTADMYGPYRNEELVGRFLRTRRDRAILATKFGIVRSSDSNARGVDNRPEHIRASIDGSLKRLGVEVVDLYYAHRVDPAVPIEETVGVMGELVRAGKVRAIGLSEVSAATLRQGAAVHPIAAVQSEYSLFTRDPEVNGVLAACREVGAAFVAYSPLGRGVLTGTVVDASGLADGDFRRRLPRFQAKHAERNRALVASLTGLAAQKGCTAGQLALAWLLHRGEDVIPIPGTRRVARLEENVAAADLQLTSDEIARLDAAFPAGAASGERSTPQGMQLLDA